MRIVGQGLSGIGLGGNDSQGPFIGNLLADFGAAIGLVGNDGQAFFLPIQKRIHHLAVVQLAAADFEAQGPAFFVYGDVNLACAATA